MKKIFWPLIPAMALLFSCSNNKAAGTKTDSTAAMKDSPATIIHDTVMVAEEPKADSVYAYLKKITDRNDSVIIDADYIQFLTGDAAIVAAKKNHEADTSYDDKGKITSISVDNDYYILNESKKIRQLLLAKDAVLKFMDNQYRTKPIKDNSVASFKQVYGEAPYILTLKNNVIVKLEEVYLP